MKVTIREGFAGVLFRKGLFVRVLKPGKHRYSYFLGERVEEFDVRIKVIQGYGSFTTTDGISLVVTMPFTYYIADLKKYVSVASEPNDVIRGVATHAISLAITGRELEAIEKDAGSFIKVFGDAVAKSLNPYGIAVDEVYAPILTVPKNIRNAAEAQIAAKKKAQADLEEARGRTAVLRHYANSAELIKDKPEILQLMLGQKAKNIHVDFGKQR